MIKAHSPINWENEPSFNTPINEENLNKMDKTIGVLDDRIIEQETSKLDKSIAYTMVKDISFNENNGVFTVTRLNGSTFTIDTKLEKISINFDYNAETQQIEIILIDGTKQYIDISSLISPIDFVDNDTIGWEVTEDGKVKAKVLDGSITEDMLQPNYLADIKVETAKSAQSMANAKISENNAKQSELNAKASEEQALEYSNNAQPLAQSVSGNNPTATNSTDGKPTYLNNKGYTKQDSTPTPDNPIRINGLADKGYFDGDLVQGHRSTTTSTPNGNANYITNKNVIECKEGDTLEIMYEVGARLVFQFFNDGTWVEQIGVSSGETVTEYSCTVPSGANQAYFFIQYANITPSTAKHICVTINGQYAIRVKTHGKNLCNSSWLMGNWDNQSLTYQVRTASYLPIKPDTTYTLSCASGYSLSCKLHEHSLDHTVNVGVFSASGNNKLTITTPSNAHYMLVNIYDVNQNTMTINDSFNFQLEEGNKATDYEPYTETEALIPVSAPFYKGDYIELYVDGSGCEYRKMGSVVYDGSDDEEWVVFKDNVFRIVIPDTKTALQTSKCSHFANVNQAYNGDVGTYCDHTDTNKFFNTEFSNISDWKAWLQSNPITVVYELATPTSTPLTAEQVSEALKLRTYKGVTCVNADGEVVMRYYVDNASGETVSMLQGMASNDGSGDVTELFKTITVTVSATLPANEITSISIPIDVPSGYSIFGIKSIHNNTLELLYGFSCGDDSVSVSVKNTSELETQGSVTVDISFIKTSAIS